MISSDENHKAALNSRHLTGLVALAGDLTDEIHTLRYQPNYSKSFLPPSSFLTSSSVFPASRFLSVHSQSRNSFIDSKSAEISKALSQDFKMEISFRGKKVLVTGAGRGIGRDLVATLVNQGATVYAVSKTEELLKQLQAEYPSVVPVLVDLRDWEATGKALENIEAVDHLVNNAGVAVSESFLEITPDAVDTIFDVNVKAVINVTQIIAKKMISAGIRGSVVNVSSVSAQKTAPGLLTYCSSKAAVDMLTKGMASELGKHGIRVNSVNPTIVWTDMGRQLWTDPAKSGPILARIPLGRFAETEEVVNAILFLLSDKTGMTTGETLLLDGGYSAK